ncbi:MAG TPA: MmgE/PrpD family protein [Burkholderiales bacterium]|nr:MmgE/PrpD family protein [Burkholderiales bacterium]
MVAANPAQADAVVRAFSDLSEKLRWDALTEKTRKAVQYELLDYLGCLIAGRALMGLPGWVAELAARGGRADATIVGGRADAAIVGSPKVPAPIAALANGYYGHVLEYDDTHDDAVLHAGAAAIPAALAAAEYRNINDPKKFLEAALLGIEVTCRLGMATKLNLVDGGWIYTPLLGQFGAAAAAARLLNADAKTFAHAFGIAYSLASGNHQSSREGASTKHAQPGFAAHNGVNAALMAINGLDGVSEVFSGKDGLARVYLRNQFDAARAVVDLGKSFETERLSFKPYPTCRLTHPAASAALALRARLGAHAQEATALELEVGPQAWDVVGRPEPTRIFPSAKVTAQFSVYWTVAVAWAYGEVNPLHVFSEVPPTPAVRAWLERITCKPYANAGTRDIGGCTLRVSGAFGTETITVDYAKGHPDNPFTDEEVTRKFASNVTLAGWHATQAHEFSAYILRLDRQTTLAPLYRQLAAPIANARD